MAWQCMALLKGDLTYSVPVALSASCVEAQQVTEMGASQEPNGFLALQTLASAAQSVL